MICSLENVVAVPQVNFPEVNVSIFLTPTLRRPYDEESAEKGEIPDVYKNLTLHKILLYPDCLFVASPEYLKISLGRHCLSHLFLIDCLVLNFKISYLINSLNWTLDVCKNGGTRNV